MHQRLVALEDLAEAAAPARPVFGNGRLLQPAPAGVLVEVGAGIDRLVHRALVDGRRLRLRLRHCAARRPGCGGRRRLACGGRSGGGRSGRRGSRGIRGRRRSLGGRRAGRGFVGGLGLRRRAAGGDGDGEQKSLHSISSWRCAGARPTAGRPVYFAAWHGRRSSRARSGTRAGCSSASRPSGPRPGSRGGAIRLPDAEAR